MTRLHLCVSGDAIGGVLDWLADECGIVSTDVATTLGYPGADGRLHQAIAGTPAVAVGDAVPHVMADDVVIVAGQDIERAIGDLLSMGIRNLYNGNEMIRRRGAARRFVEVAASLYIGPTTPTGDGSVPQAAGRFPVDPIVAGQVPRHKLFIVNSMPKSGTVWLVAMLERILGVHAGEQITVSHVADLEADWNKENNHGAVTLVRDLRDVVVSWFHDTVRADCAMGFAAPRYPDIRSFYYELFLGTVLGTKRFYFGDLERWLNLVSAHYIPVIRYEDMLVDTEASVRRVLTFWRVAPPASLRQIVEDHAFASMAATAGSHPGFVDARIAQGHLRRGRCGSWRDEMPEGVARDINERFAGYQRRLAYI